MPKKQTKKTLKEFGEMGMRAEGWGAHSLGEIVKERLKINNF